MGGQSPWLDVDVQAPMGKLFQGNCLITVVAMLEVDVEVFREVLDDRDVFAEYSKLGADGPLDHFRLDLRA